MVLGKQEESHKQIQDVLSLIKEVSQSNTEMQYSTMMALQGIQKRLTGRHLDLFKISLRSP
jgi:hypothetical protein